MASSWKFAVLSDSGITYRDSNASYILEILANDIKNQGVDLVIFPGDMISSSDNGSHANEKYYSWKSVMMPLYYSGIPIYVIRGNHDWVVLGNISENNGNLGKDPYLKNFPLAGNAISPDGGYSYSFIHKNAKFIGFDQFINRNASFDDQIYASGSNHGQMMNSWVTDQINSSTSHLNFAFAHEPLFPSESHHDCMANDPDSRDALVLALETHHGAYFCGHDHLYLRANISDGQGNSIPELIVGTAGTGNYNYAPVMVSDYSGRYNYSVDKVYGSSINPNFGYLLVTVDEFDNIWKGEFRGFNYFDVLGMGPPYPGLIQVLDKFTIFQEDSSRGYNNLSIFLQSFRSLFPNHWRLSQIAHLPNYMFRLK